MGQDKAKKQRKKEVIAAGDSNKIMSSVESMFFLLENNFHSFHHKILLFIRYMQYQNKHHEVLEKKMS